MQELMLNKEVEEISESASVSEAQKPYVISVRNMPEKVESQTVYNEQYVTSAFVVGMSLLGVYIILAYLFGFNLYYSAILGLGAILFYVCAIFYMFAPKKVVKVTQTVIKDIAYPTIVYVDKPVEVEKFIEVEKEVPVEKVVTKYVERPVIEYVDREVEKVVEKPIVKYIEMPVEVPIEVEKIVEKEVPVEKVVTKYVERPSIEYVVGYSPKNRIKRKAKKKLNIPKYKYLASIETKRYHKKTCRLGKLIKKKYKLNSNSVAQFKKKKFKACKNCFKRK